MKMVRSLLIFLNANQLLKDRYRFLTPELSYAENFMIGES